MKKLLILTALLALAVPAVAGATQTERSTKTVGAYNNVFKPKSVKVKRGTKVKWVIRQGRHNVVGKGFASPVLSKGRTYSRKFTRKGTYPYTCTLHPGMDGKVVVR